MGPVTSRICPESKVTMTTRRSVGARDDASLDGAAATSVIGCPCVDGTPGGAGIVKDVSLWLHRPGHTLKS